MQPTTTTTTSVVPTHRWGHTNKVANGVTELCGLWSKNIHSTWYQQFKGFAARKGVVAPGFPRVSKTRYVSYDNMAHIILRNSLLWLWLFAAGGCKFVCLNLVTIYTGESPQLNP